MDLYYSLRRTVRKEDYEEWLYYTSTKEKFLRYDTILLHFLGNENEIYVFTTDQSAQREEDYMNGIVNLVHDMRGEDGIIHDFELQFIEVPKEYDEDSQIDFIERKIKEILNIEHIN